jgi:hypothetical protein
MRESRSKLYQEEFNYIFSRKAFCVRGALVTSAFIEGQILLLTEYFLEEHGVKLGLRRYQGHRQSLSILKENGIITLKEFKNIEIFQKERNISIHGPFKGMTRSDWEKQNNKVVEFGRPIVRTLDEKLYLN